MVNFILINSGRWGSRTHRPEPDASIYTCTFGDVVPANCNWDAVEAVFVLNNSEEPSEIVDDGLIQRLRSEWWAANCSDVGTLVERARWREACCDVPKDSEKFVQVGL